MEENKILPVHLESFENAKWYRLCNRVLRAVRLFLTLFSSLSVRTATSRCKFRFSASERKNIYYYYSVREMDAEMQNELDFKWKTRRLIYHSFQFLPQTSLGRSDVVLSSLAITPSSWQRFSTLIVNHRPSAFISRCYTFSIFISTLNCWHTFLTSTYSQWYVS